MFTEPTLDCLPILRETGKQFVPELFIIDRRGCASSLCGSYDDGHPQFMLVARCGRECEHIPMSDYLGPFLFPFLFLSKLHFGSITVELYLYGQRHGP